MKRRLAWILLLVVLAMVTACRPAGSLGDAAKEESAATEELGICPPDSEDCDDEESDVGTEATEVSTPQTTEKEQAAEPDSSPANPTDNPLAPRDTDWVKGAEDPLITLIEYADYF